MAKRKLDYKAWAEFLLTACPNDAAKAVLNDPDALEKYAANLKSVMGTLTDAQIQSLETLKSQKKGNAKPDSKQRTLITKCQSYAKKLFKNIEKEASKAEKKTSMLRDETYHTEWSRIMLSTLPTIATKAINRGPELFNAFKAHISEDLNGIPDEMLMSLWPLHSVKANLRNPNDEQAKIIKRCQAYAEKIYAEYMAKRNNVTASAKAAVPGPGSLPETVLKSNADTEESEFMPARTAKPESGSSGLKSALESAMTPSPETDRLRARISDIKAEIVKAAGKAEIPDAAHVYGSEAAFRVVRDYETRAKIKHSMTDDRKLEFGRRYQGILTAIGKENRDALAAILRNYDNDPASLSKADRKVLKAVKAAFLTSLKQEPSSGSDISDAPDILDTPANPGPESSVPETPRGLKPGKDPQEYANKILGILGKMNDLLSSAREIPKRQKPDESSEMPAGISEKIPPAPDAGLASRARDAYIMLRDFEHYAADDIYAMAASPDNFRAFLEIYPDIEANFAEDEINALFKPRKFKQDICRLLKSGYSDPLDIAAESEKRLKAYQKSALCLMQSMLERKLELGAPLAERLLNCYGTPEARFVLSDFDLLRKFKQGLFARLSGLDELERKEIEKHFMTSGNFNRAWYPESRLQQRAVAKACYAADSIARDASPRLKKDAEKHMRAAYDAIAEAEAGWDWIRYATPENFDIFESIWPEISALSNPECAAAVMLPGLSAIRSMGELAGEYLDTRMRGGTPSGFEDMMVLMNADERSPKDNEKLEQAAWRRVNELRMEYVRTARDMFIKKLDETTAADKPENPEDPKPGRKRIPSLFRNVSKRRI